MKTEQQIKDKIIELSNEQRFGYSFERYALISILEWVLRDEVVE